MARGFGRIAWRLLPLCLLVAGLTACARDPFSAGCRTEPEARLAIEMRRNIAVVPAMVDDQRAAMILDTGAEHTVLLAGFVNRIGLVRDARHATTIRGIGTAMASATAHPDEITLDGVRVRHPFVIVGAFSTGDLPGGVPDGLLGADILAAFDVDVDIPDGQLTLYPACPVARPLWAGPYAELPGRLVRGRFVVPLFLDGVPVPVAVDTGAEYSLVSARAAEAVGVPPSALSQDPPAYLTVVGPDEVTARVHRFKQVRLGQESYANPVLPVIAFPAAPAIDGLLGMNYLSRHRVWLSYGTGQVFVAKPPFPR
ncbi:MAG: retroviral-like aspartic protease family protein [Alphaproteobacteria bacterium]|nr:retroviral-like aspartic protease family protein [Alphaproteobacteria bacterium]